MKHFSMVEIGGLIRLIMVGEHYCRYSERVDILIRLGRDSARSMCRMQKTRIELDKRTALISTRGTANELRFI